MAMTLPVFTISTPQVIQIVGWITAGLVATFGAVKKVGPIALAWRDAQRARETTFVQLGKDVAFILKELSPNGGTSLKDQVTAQSVALKLEIVARRLTEGRAMWEGTVTATGETEPIHVTPAWLRLTGLSVDDTRNGGWARCIAPEDRARVMQEADEVNRAALTKTVRVFQASYTCVNVLTGERTPVQHLGCPVFDARSRIVGWIGIMTPTATDEAPPMMRS